MLIELFDHMELCTEAEVARMLPLVSSQRREEALRYVHTHGRFCCLKSYLMLMEIIGAVSPTLDNTTPAFQTNEFGKPFIPGRDDIQFSISHTKNAVAVAFSRYPIGLDIEQIRHQSDSLVRKTMNEAEQRKIAESGNPDAAFTALWTQKEAVLKLRGTGILDELHDVLTTCDDICLETHINASKNYVWSVAQYRNSL